MINNMNKNKIKAWVTVMLCFIGFINYAQDIHFTFANAQNTNDGNNDYYEVDVMIQTINNTGDFKLGSGQLYVAYNTAAFGENVFTNNSFSATQPSPDYIVGQNADGTSVGLYGSFTIHDNTNSRVSWAFSQILNETTFAADNVKATPFKLVHLKFKYRDATEDPMVLFEQDDTYIDQFFTACGSQGGSNNSVDCTNYPGIQLVNDTFDSSNATLSNNNFRLLSGFSIYPNPTKEQLNINGDTFKLKSIEIYSILGKRVMKITEHFNKIDLSKLKPSLYILKLNSENSSTVFKIIKD